MELLGMLLLRGSRGVEDDEREGDGGRGRVSVSVPTSCVEPGLVAGLDLYELVADLERERALPDVDQFERAGVVGITAVALAGLQRPRPQLQRASAHLEQCAAAGRSLPQLGRVGGSRYSDGRRLLVADEIGQGDLERTGESEERADARVGLALLDLDDQAAADPAPGRRFVERPRARSAKTTDGSRERPRDALFGGEAHA